MAKTIVFNIVLNGEEKIIRSSKQLREALAEIRKELEKTEFGTDAYQKLTNEQAKLLNVSGRLQAATRQTRNELKASGQDASVARGSYEQLSAQLSVLSARWRAMGREARESFDGKRLEREIAGVTRELSQLDARVGRFQRNVGNYQSAFGQISGQIGTFVAGGFLVQGFQTLVNGIERLGGTIVRTNATISDSLADVQRVAKLTDAEAEQLLETLKGFDTRTTLDELLKLAAIGGRLGVPRKELAGFTKALDDLNVALGGELGGNVEEVANTLGKLDQIFKVEGETAGERITKIGNAIVDLANKGVASGEFLADFSQRLAGISSISGITLGQTLGLGAAFQELGQSSEVSGTAVTQLILKIGTDVPKYAKLAGKSVKEFGDTLNNNPVEALIQLSEGISNNKDGLAELSTAFADAEARGVRVSATLGVIGKNADLFREKITDGTAALKETGEITDAVAIKQDTLGAAIQRVGNNILEYFVNSGFANWLRDVLLGVNDFVKALSSGEKATTGLGRGLQVISNIFSALWSVQRGLTKAVGDFVLMLLDKAAPAASFIATKFAQLYNVSVDVSNQFRELAGLKPFEKIDIAGLQKDIELYAASVKKAREEEAKGGVGSTDQRSESRQARLLRMAAEQRKLLQATNQDTARTVEAIKTQIQGLQDALEQTTNRNQAAKIQQQITALEKELVGILGEAGVKGGKQFSEGFLEGSIGKLKQDISKLTAELEEVLTPAQFVKVSQEIGKLTEQLNAKTREFDNAVLTAAGASLSPAALPQTIVDIGTELNGVLAELGVERTKIESDTVKKIEEIAKAGADRSTQYQIEKNAEKNQAISDAEQELATQMELISIEMFGQIGEATAQFLTGQIDSFGDFMKEFVLILLDAVQKQILAQIAATTAIEAATKPFPANIATTLIKVAAINAAFGVAKAAIRGFDEGGYTGQGTNIRDQSGERVAGVVHANEYVIPKKVLQSRQGRELAEAAEKLRPYYGYRSNYRRGFAEGGFTSITTPSPATQAIIVKSTLNITPEVERTIERAVARGSAVGSKVGSKEGVAEGARTVEQSQTLKDRTGF